MHTPRSDVERVAVVSSTIASVGYDRVNYVLEVEFVGGNIYQYYDVPEAVHTEFMGSASLGSYLSNYIKTQYRYMRI